MTRKLSGSCYLNTVMFSRTCVQGQGQGTRGQGQGQGLAKKARPRPRSRTRTWDQGQGQGQEILKANTKDIQKPL